MLLLRKVVGGLAIFGLLMFMAWALAQNTLTRNRLQAKCTRRGFPELRYMNGNSPAFCLKRVNGTDSLVVVQ